MRRSALLSAVVIVSGCRIGEHIAAPPIDAGASAEVDAGDVPDATPCEPGDDQDGDGLDDCAELDDADPFTDPTIFNGLHAIIGERPEVTGNCSALDDRAELDDRFDPPVDQLDVRAGWDFDTGADSYNDPTYGFSPNWASAMSGRFSVRYRGLIHLTADRHCFSIDIGATGTDIINGRNGCGQVWVGPGTVALAETGFGAASVEAAVGCLDVAEDGPVAIDLVFWYFNIFEQAKFHVRRCAGTGCTPSAPITPAMVHAE